LFREVIPARLKAVSYQFFLPAEEPTQLRHRRRRGWAKRVQTMRQFPVVGCLFERDNHAKITFAHVSLELLTDGKDRVEP
jgi:hypothetical protein